ncbi:MAG: class I SAM-dependent methyltransferase [Acidobacteriota bacterium]
MSEFSYDDVPYPSYAFPQTSPDRLATMATLFGMQPAPPNRCRVLEIGCGDGTNLLSHAFLLPESEFVGIDLSSVQIADAKDSAKHLGLTNTRFEQINILDFDQDYFGKFDYIVTHGVFSWVPSEVRAKLLEIYIGALAEQGVGYISYNAFPGCHLRRIVWDLMRFHTMDEPEPGKKIVMGRKIVRLLTDSLPEENIYKKVMEHELESVLKRDPENILHDDLSKMNQPFYFNEFAELIESYGLQYLCEADPLFLGDGTLSPGESQLMEIVKNDFKRREVYRDFMELARFRSSLVCGPDAQFDKNAAVSSIPKLAVASPVKPLKSHPMLADETPESFEGSKGGAFELNHPLTKATLAFLRSVWPRSASFDEILRGSRSLLGSDGPMGLRDISRTQEFLYELFRNGFIRLHVHRFNFSASVSERPEASAFARWQVERGSRSVATMAGVNIDVELEVVREMICLSDGSRSVQQLADELYRRVAVPFSERDNFLKYSPKMIDDNLRKMAEWGLLVK